MSNTQSSSLDAPPLALRLPLYGSRLIEASAGTGKTWTIAALYLRLVLGHGATPALGQDLLDALSARAPLLPAQILVMTFTRAATQELNARIRERLSEAARFFRGESDEGQADALLHSLRRDYAPGPVRELAAWRLANAAETMDEAAIYTIDAWCNKVLQSYASLTGALQGQELGGDTQTLWQWAALDFWRNQIYPLQPEALQQVLAIWPDAQQWLQHSQAWQNTALPVPKVDAELASTDTVVDAGLERDPERDPEPVNLQAWLTAQLALQNTTLAQLAQGLSAGLAEFEQWLDAQTDKDGATGKHWSGVKLKPQSYRAWLDAIRHWVERPGARIDGVQDKQLWRLTPEGLLDARTSKAPPLSLSELPAAADNLRAVLQALAALPSIEQGIVRMAVQSTQQRWRQLKAQQGAMDFADLLVRVQQALASEQGATLRQRLLAEYPVAMIDEFQDTSPGQYQVFHDLYRPERNDPANALLLIGDPKQSIYGFRGADIYSYLAAKTETLGRHYALDTNFRSTHAVVDAVNYVFAQAEQRPGPGAFFFRSADAPAGTAATGAAAQQAQELAGNPLPFRAVQANGLPSYLANAQGQRVPALSLFTQQEAQSNEAGNDWMAQYCAAHIVQWLQTDALSFQRAASADQPAHRPVPLQPGDIAILVHRRRDAQRMQQALRQRGLSSVYLSDRESVYASAQASDVVAWLQAVAQPTDVALARAALATPLMALTPGQLLHYADHEEALDEWLQRLQQCQIVWRKQGVLPMLRQLIHQGGLASQWLARADGQGERMLTNVLHIAELLQHASRAHEGEQSLIRFLVQQIHLSAQSSGAMEAEEQTVRLESDAQLIQIVTIHKSKGLEYPVVMLPFGSYMKPVKKGSADWGAAESGNSDEAEEADGGSQASSDDERLREDLRLLYVALTRAKQALWVGFAINRRMNSKKGSELHRSALGYLLAGQAEQAVADEAWWPLAQAWQAQCPDIAVHAVPVALASSDAEAANPHANALLAQKYRPPPAHAHWRAALQYPAGIDQQFAIASFSMLARGASEGKAVQGSIEVARAVQPLPDTEREPEHDWQQDESPADSPAPSHQAFLWQPAARLADDETQAAAALEAVAITPRSLGQADGSATWHALAGSSRLGDWMHQALELLQQEGFPVEPHELQWQRLKRRAEQAGFETQWPQLQAWLAALMATPLPLQASVWDDLHQPRLSDVLEPPLQAPRLADMDKSLSELEFWLPVEQAQAQQLDALCRQYCWPGLARPALTRRQWHGMLMGFADLVVYSQGRYWVVDYKTNRLGDGAGAYHDAALREAVLHHRYDLQAMLYVLALHRLLQSRMPAYRPEQHLGGAMYWFLRGIDHPGMGAIHFETPLRMLDALDAALGREAPHTRAHEE